MREFSPSLGEAGGIGSLKRRGEEAITRGELPLEYTAEDELRPLTGRLIVNEMNRLRSRHSSWFSAAFAIHIVAESLARGTFCAAGNET